MILIGMGANLQHPVYGEPLDTLKAAQSKLLHHGVACVKRSRWYRSAPVPLTDQPWFVNAVMAVAAPMPAADLLRILHDVEKSFGRVRKVRWEPRMLDLDLLCYDEYISENTDQAQGAVIPHPHLHERAFVLLPLRDVCPGWVHPRTGATLEEMIAALPAGQGGQDMEVVAE
jgi:2-amino-4-hydroxy-6-hydroxymethyldihydropteridine diphosphokinase